MSGLMQMRGQISERTDEREEKWTQINGWWTKWEGELSRWTNWAHEVDGDVDGDMVFEGIDDKGEE